MKHKSVEVLVRSQFNIPDDDDVKVTFIMLFNNMYTFEVEWFNSDVCYQSHFELPHIESSSKELLN